MKRTKAKDEKPGAIPLERLLSDNGAEVPSSTVDAFIAGKSNVLPLGKSHARRSYDILEKESRRDERLLSALKDELFKNAAANLRHKDRQIAKAQKPRGKGIDGRTISDLIVQLAREHPDQKPREIWPHLESAISEWAGECHVQNLGGKPSYKYPAVSGVKENRTLTYKHFGDVLREVRKNR